MNERQVSIIVPMYNAETTIKRCIQSLLAQTYPNIEMIIINDGSTDKSSEYVEQLALHNARIQLATQRNQGPAAARNYGLSLATGTYIQFVDADDWIEPTMTAHLVEKITDSELVICGYKTERRTIHPTESGNLTRENWLKHIGDLYAQTLLPSPCNKLYRRNIIEQNALHFSPNMSLGEDLLFNLHYMTHCQNITFTQESPYIYCYETDSLTRKYIPDLFHIQQHLHKYFIEFLHEQQCATPDNLAAAERIFLHGTAYAINNLYHPNTPFNSKEQYKALKEILSNQTVKVIAASKRGMTAFFIRQQQVIPAHIFYRTKSMIKRIFMNRGRDKWQSKTS